MGISKIATLGGGCYWCLEAFFQRVKGVTAVVSGYSDDAVDSKGSAEVVQITFDPQIISYRELLEIFFVMHDPTTLNRQGYDIGYEYRSVIFCHDDQQKKEALDVASTYAADLWQDPIITQIVDFKEFQPADEASQNFYNKRPEVGYCQVIINPKLQKLRQAFAGKLKPGA